MLDLHRLRLSIVPLLLAVYLPFCTPTVRPTMPASAAPMSELWEEPRDLAERDLFTGQWSKGHAPDPQGVYTFVRPKKGGVNPGVVVTDARGREWHVKQSPGGDLGNEGPSEVVLSRVLSALGYHQPPVYFLSSFTMRDESGTHVEPGGRFRLHSPSLRDRGAWSWQKNPFVNTRPYNGLLVILVMLNSSDLKNSNNTLYEVVGEPRVTRWYVVRDIGSALGQTARWRPRRNNIDEFERSTFIRGVAGGFVEFDYHGFHQELIRRRITPVDLGWASTLIGRLSAAQWRDAFRAGGYPPETAARYIDRLSARIAQARQIAGDHAQQVERR